jgi:CelD/BcsL family acetyltransferase involved in cellulose biosynthesis
MDHLESQVVWGERGFESLAADWDSLAALAAEPSYAHSRVWWSSFLRNLAGQRPVAFLHLRRSGRPAGIIPAWNDSAAEIAKVRVPAASLPTHDHFVRPDLLLDPESMNSIAPSRLLSLLADGTGWRFAAFLTGPIWADSQAAAWLSRWPGESVTQEPAGASNYLPALPEKEFRAQISKNFRKNLRKAEQRAAETPGLRVVWGDETNTAEALSRFFAVEASGWKASEGTAIRQSAPLTAFYRDAFRGWAREQRGAVHVLLVDDRPVAAQLTVQAGRRCYVLKIGYDESFSSIAPGQVLLAQLRARCAEESPPRIVDLVTDMDWHDAWKPLPRPLLQYTIFRSTATGLLAYSAWQAKSHVKSLLGRT